jgi:hypothetical protein
MRRLVFTVARGKPRYAEMAMGLGRSLSLIGDTNPRAIVTDIPGYDWKRYYDHVFEPKAARSALDKLFAFDYIEADAVYSIDCDCLAFKRLDAVFEYCQGRAMALQGGWQTAGKWHGAEVADILSRHGFDRLPRFNGGAIYYEHGEAFDRVLGEMRSVEERYADSGFADFRGNASEEVCVALAMSRTGIGEMVPDETDFMHTGAGLVGKLKMNVLENECRFISRREKVRYVEPYVFHAAAYSNFAIYWRQLDMLAWLERYEDTHPRGYRSPWYKFRRSMERRYLKHIARKL